MPRVEITEAEISLAIGEVKTEMDVQLKKKGRLSFASPHEIYGVLAEELQEYFELVRWNPEDNLEADECLVRQGKELAQIAVAAIFGLATTRRAETDWI